MPELPEVETVVRDLRPRLVGRRFADVHVSRKRLRQRWSKEWNQRLTGCRVLAIERRGKWILLKLDNGGTLGIHLGMTGQLCVMPAEAAKAPHTHLIFPLDRGHEHLRFRDIRRFGCASLFADPAAVAGFFDGKLGPEPFDLEMGYWRDRLAATNRCLKAILLDQRVVAGVGNIYADEGLFTARLHPLRRGCDLDQKEATRLRKALVTVLTFAIERRGSSIRNYVDGAGRKGQYQEEFRVYGRFGEPCRRCRQPVERIRLAGRSTHFCSRCQPL